MASNVPPPMGAISPPVYYPGMNSPLPPNHHAWGRIDKHPRECLSSYHIPSRPMPRHGAVHGEWAEYYLDRKAMITAAGKTVKFTVSPDRTNGAPNGRTVRTYIAAVTCGL